MRTSLAKGTVETCTDVPCVVMGKNTMRWKNGRKAKVSPMLSYRANDLYSLEGTSCSLDSVEVDGGFELSEETRRQIQKVEPEASRQHLIVEATEERQQASAAERDVQPARKVADALPPEQPPPPPDEVQILLRTMRSAHPQTYFQAAVDLERFMCQQGQAKSAAQHLVSLGGLFTLVGVLETDAVQADTYQVACRLLIRTLTSGAASRADLLASGGIRAVLKAMAAHVTAEPVQRFGCCLLKELVVGSSHARQEVFECDGVNLVATAMRNHISSAALQIAACGVVRNLTLSGGVVLAEQQAALASAGGLEAVVAAMIAHQADPNVQSACCWSLACLTSQSPELQEEARASGATARVLVAMDCHVAIASLQEAACWALKELVGSETTLAIWSGAVRAVSRAMREHSAEQVQKAARVALRKLALRKVVPAHACAVRRDILNLVKPSIVKRRRSPAVSLPPIQE